MKKIKKFAAVVLSSVITASLPILHLSADENYIISSDDSRYKYIENADGTISIAASEFSLVGFKGDIIIPDTLDEKKVTGICSNGFTNSDITSVVVPDSICSIGSLAFANCLTLAQVTLPDTITYMGELAFSTTPFETSLIDETENGFAVIEDYILYLYTGSEAEIEVPDNVKTIANSAFANNGAYSRTEILSVTLPDNVSYIGANAFENCNSLSEITIKTGLKSVGENAIDSDVLIKGYIGTYAQTFAQANGNEFEPLIKKGQYITECDYDENFKQYYFSTDTKFSKEGVHVYKRNYDGTREEITDWSYDSTPAELYAAAE